MDLHLAIARSRALARCTLFLAACGLACGRVGYDATDEASPGGPEDTVDASDRSGEDAGPRFDAASSIAFIERIGSDSCLSPDTVVTVPSAGIEAGSTLIVQVVRRVSGGTVTVTDSKGNLYSEVESTGDTGLRIFLLQGTLTTALVAQDTINIIESNPTASAVIVSAMRNASPQAFSSHIGGADDGDISIPFTNSLPGLVLCAGGIRQGSVVMTDNWQELATEAGDCGGNGEVSAFAYWIPAGRDGLASCEATLELETGFKKWEGIVRSYGEVP